MSGVVYRIHRHIDGYDRATWLCIGPPEQKDGHVAALTLPERGSSGVGVRWRSWPSRLVSFEEVSGLAVPDGLAGRNLREAA